MKIVPFGAASAATPDASPWVEALLSLNAATGLIEWAPVALFAGMLLWLAYVTHPRRTETLNERSARETEEANRS